MPLSRQGAPQEPPRSTAELPKSSQELPRSFQVSRRRLPCRLASLHRPAQTEEELLQLFKEGADITFIPRPDLPVGTSAVVPGVGGAAGQLVSFQPIGDTVPAREEEGHKYRKNVKVRTRGAQCVLEAPAARLAAMSGNRRSG